MSNDDKNNLIYELNKINTYPDINDINLQSKIYNKREFYYYKTPYRNILKEYGDIKKFRDDRCSGNTYFRSQQSLVSNFINPNTPYKGLLVYHGLGTGKTGVGVSTAENFKEQIIKYNTKIHILVPSKLLKETWQDDIIKFTNNTYLIDNNIKQAKKNIKNYYKIITYKSFYKKVLGEKIVNKILTTDNKIKKIYKKNNGNFDREISINSIDNLDNTLLIIDEAHNIVGNKKKGTEWYNAVKKIINTSNNLKILLLSASPMINYAYEIIELINLLRPKKDKIIKDKVFIKNNIDYNMEFNKNGKEYLYKMLNGYVSHFRGNNPLTFPDEVNHGELIDDLLITYVVRCPMKQFQLNAYNKVINNKTDSLKTQAQSVSNFCFPYIKNNELISIQSKHGLNLLINQIKNNNETLCKLINEKFMNNEIKNIDNILKLSNDQTNITGLILHEKYLSNFSIKFYQVLINLNKLINENAGTAFIYFNLVQIGIDLFKEVLLINGYLEYREDGLYNINNNTRDAITGITYENYKGNSFNPCTFYIMKGTTDDDNENLPEIKKNILDNVFSNPNNRYGKYIKILLGSRVMNEGITLENVKDVHILDVHYNLGKLLQAIGRVVRECKHYKITDDNNKYPKVNIYKYVVALYNNKLSNDEERYKKAELKFILVKDIERMLKEISIDCPLNFHSNIFPEELDKYKNCIPIKDYLNNPTNYEKKNICPLQCDLQKCNFKCYDKQLNLKYYDSNNELYKKISKNELDFSTFNNTLINLEINKAKNKIKELYKFKYVYKLNSILSKVKKEYTNDQLDLFEPFFVYKALDQLIPITENDFNNFNDIIYDKYDNPGYIIYRDIYYIFQPFNQNENVSMYYRSNYNKELYNELSLYNYLKINNKLNNKDNITYKSNKIKYDFNSILEYYNTKEENNVVGIIDKPDKKIFSNSSNNDIFKIRYKKDKNIDKKKGINIPTLKGTVCNFKQKNELIEYCKDLNINYNNITNKDDLCNIIKEKLLYLEKYSTDEKNNKLTYVIIPKNHPIFPFPYNLEDRAKYIINILKNKIPYDFTYKIVKLNKGVFYNINDKLLHSYEISINNNNNLKVYYSIFNENKFELKNNIWYKLIE